MDEEKEKAEPISPSPRLLAVLSFLLERREAIESGAPLRIEICCYPDKIQQRAYDPRWQTSTFHDLKELAEQAA